MSVQAHLSHLTTKHQDLEDKIVTELKSPAPDSLRLTLLKRKKLRIKDRMRHLAD